MECEFGPHGHYLILLLDGFRKCVKQGLELPLYETNIDRKSSTWKGKAKIPVEYFPPDFVDKINAYGIHTDSSGDRVYKALYPVPGDQPDFHRIQHFGQIPKFSTSSSKVWEDEIDKSLKE